MNAMKKILALALAGVMALALLTGCGTGSSASHKSIAKAMADYDNGQHFKTTITCTSSAVLDAKLQELAERPGFETAVKYDKDAGKQAINLNAPHSHISSTSNLDDERQIGLITTSFTDDTTGKEVKVRFAVVVSKIPTATP